MPIDWGAVNWLNVGLLSAFALAGCSKKSSDDFTVGFIYIDRKDDYGYSQAHAQGAAAVKEKVPGVKVLEVEKVPETDAVQQMGDPVAVRLGLSRAFQGGAGNAACWLMADGFFSLKDPQP